MKRQILIIAALCATGIHAVTLENDAMKIVLANRMRRLPSVKS